MRTYLVLLNASFTCPSETEDLLAVAPPVVSPFIFLLALLLPV